MIQELQERAQPRAFDPVCGQVVYASPQAPRCMYEGVQYYFCSTQCRKAFLAKPWKYAHGYDRGPYH